MKPLLIFYFRNCIKILGQNVGHPKIQKGTLSQSVEENSEG